MKRVLRTLALLLSLALLTGSLAACGEKRVTDLLTLADSVTVDGTRQTTVEARMGAFKGGNGSVIEFRFDKPQTINTVYLVEKTTAIRQYNIYAEVDGVFMCVFTGKEITDANLVFPTVSATALRVEILNIAIGEDAFIMQGVNAYYFPEYESEVF